jgi:hypothetical protein
MEYKDVLGSVIEKGQAWMKKKSWGEIKKRERTPEQIKQLEALIREELLE